MTKAFTKETGIDVKVHSGEAPELASELAKEGASSHADVFFTENSPELELLSEKGLLAKVAPATLASVPAADSGSNGDWVGVLARENVLVFNKDMIKEAELPASLLDLAKPEWKGKLAIAPTDADFLPLVGAVAALKGRQAALDWLKGLRENAAIFDDDEGVAAAVDRGAAAVGIINNYYWARLSAEKGADQMKSAIHHFAGGDVGGLMNVSGAAVLEDFTQSRRGAEVPRLPGEQAGAGDAGQARHHLRVPADGRGRRQPGAEADERIVAAALDPQADRGRSRRRETASRGGAHLMAAVAGASTGGVEAVSVRATLARPPAALIAAALLGVTLILLPIFYTVIEAASVDFRDAVDLLIRPLVGTLLFNTVSLVIAASLASAIIGTAAAWVVERTDVPGRNVWSALIAAPLAIPPFVTSFAWVSMSNALQDFAGALLVVTCAYFPLVYLPVAAALRGLDPALEETARSLGESASGCFLRVVLPQLRPALLGGVLLVALNTLTEFGAFALLRFRTFTTELYAQYRTGLAGPESSLVALVLVALCLALVFAEFRVRGDARYARVGAGARRMSAPAALGWSRLPVLGALGALVAATVGVPIGMIGFWLLQHAQAATSPVAPTAPELIRAALNSVGYGLFGAAAALVLAAPIGYLAVRFPSPWTALMERAAYLAQGVPGIVVALALISLTVQWVGPLYQSPALLVVAYAILFLPLALVSVRATLMQIPPGLEEVGRSLGQNGASVAWRVVAPLAAHGLGAGAALVFIFVSTELTATLLLSPIGTRTLATEVWANTSSVAFAAAAPFAALMLCLSLAVTWLFANRLSRAAFAGWG